MNVEDAYNVWAHQYDTNENKTRDLEAVSLRATLQNVNFENCLEIGCGTGKNTEWLITKANDIVSVDLSGEMLAKAKSKIQSNKVSFIQADVNNDWNFANTEKFDLVIFSLVLEHVKDLEMIFEKLSIVTKNNAYVYIGELHPFKQYTGTKARFEAGNGLQVVPCFNHNISDFTIAAKRNGFQLVELTEYFDEDNRNNLPRILTLLLQKLSA